MVGEHLRDRHARDLLRLFQPAERRRFLQLQAHIQPDADQRDAQQERNTPAPGQELGFGQVSEHGEYPDGGQVAERVADLDHRPHHAPASRPGVLHHHQHRAAPFAAEPDPLQKAQRHQQHGGGEPQLGIGRQQSDQCRAQAHDDDGGGQHRLAPDPVAEMAEDGGAERPGQEAHAVGAETDDGTERRVTGRKEQPVEHGGRCDGIEQEVVPLDRRPQDAGEQDAPHPGRLRAGQFRCIQRYDFAHGKPSSREGEQAPCQR